MHVYTYIYIYIMIEKYYIILYMCIYIYIYTCIHIYIYIYIYNTYVTDIIPWFNEMTITDEFVPLKRHELVMGEDRSPSICRIRSSVRRL